MDTEKHYLFKPEMLEIAAFLFCIIKIFQVAPPEPPSLSCSLPSALGAPHQTRSLQTPGVDSSEIVLYKLLSRVSRPRVLDQVQH